MEGDQPGNNSPIIDVQVSNGYPSMQAFFVVAQKLFIRELKLPQLWKPHQMDESNNITYDECNFAILQVADRLSAIHDHQIFEESVIQLGSEEHYRLVRLLRRPKGDSLNSLAIVQGLVRVCNFWQVSQQLSASINTEGYIEGCPDHGRLLEYIQSVIKEAQTHLQDRLAVTQRKSFRISSFQRYVRKKLVKFYMIIASVLTGARKDQIANTHSPNK